MQKYDGVDFLEIDGLFSDEELLVRDSIRKFVSDRVIPVIERHNRDGTFPADLIPAMAELGMFGANLQGYGCAGLNNVAYGLIMQELERGDSGLRSFVSVQGALCMYPIFAYGTDEQKKQVSAGDGGGDDDRLLRAHRGRLRNQPGRDAHAAREGRERIRSERQQDVDHERRHRRPRDRLGDARRENPRLPRGEGDAGLLDQGHPRQVLPPRVRDIGAEFSGLPRSAESLLPSVEGLKGPLGCLNQARYGIAWGGIGAAMACYHEALEYSKTRIQFDKPIAGFQMVQEKLAWMIREITKGQLLALQLGRLKDEGKVKAHHLARRR